MNGVIGEWTQTSRLSIGYLQAHGAAALLETARPVPDAAGVPSVIPVRVVIN